MIYGTGIDILEIERIKKLLCRHSCLTHLFGPEELELLIQKNRAESYAAVFCAKEAFAKALGTGIRGFRLNEVQILKNELNKPYYHFSGCAQKLVTALNLRFYLSISHSGPFAAAFAVAETAEKNDNP